MKKNSTLMHKCFIAAVVCFFLGLSLQAQETFYRERDWFDVRRIELSEGTSKNVFDFKNALYSSESDVPCYFELIPWTNGDLVPNVVISEIICAQLTPAELELFNKTINDTVQNEITSEIKYEKKQPFLAISLFPFKKNQISGQLEKIISFTLKINSVKGVGVSSRSKGRTWATHSVLSSGDWFSFRIGKTGIYKISYSDLEELGLNMASIGDPGNIRIYGNGGDMISENNAVFRQDDLAENSIFVYGSGDGQFDQGDYILFYAKGSVKWTYNALQDRYLHQINKYCDYARYFITTGLGPGKRISTESSLAGPADYIVNVFDDYAFHESDSLNLIKSGREWYGEVFDQLTSHSFSFLFPNIASGSSIKLKSGVLARGVEIATSFNVYVNGSFLASQSVPASSSNYVAPYAKTNVLETVFTSGSDVSLRLDYNKNGYTSPVGWLDYLELNAVRDMIFTGGQMDFRSSASIGNGKSEFRLQNANSSTVIWEVSDYLNPEIIETSLSGSDMNFLLNTDTLREFVAHDGSGYYSILPNGSVANQDLHGLGQYDMIIVTNAIFESEANRVAQMHQSVDGLSVAVIPLSLIYNEFSSGIPDVTAMRDFMKMFYDRAGSDPDLLPKYLLLFGDASYDHKDRIENNTNFVPTYQSWSSLDPTSSFLTDDYFGFLDDLESGPVGGLLDIGIGRFVVKTQDEAREYVDKLLRYTAQYDLSLQSQTCATFSAQTSNLADWRNVICFVADDNDKPGENFMGESEDIADKIDTVHPITNIDKIYCDAYTQVSTPGGQRYPDVNDAISKRVQKGALLINYIGHGGEVGWAHEAILTVSEINDWDNLNNMPMFVTATCEFSRFDDPGRTAAGEYVILNPNGGGIALFTTTRLAFSGSNASLNRIFYDQVLSKTGGEYQRLGDVTRNSKNTYGCAQVISNFVLLGDPAMRLAFPHFDVKTAAINQQPVGSGNDTIRALSKVTITGYIANNAGVKISDFNGLIYPTVFDKPMKITSNGNDAASPTDFHLQKNVIYKGKASVVNGDFTFSFIVPKDIAYAYGHGKLSYYAQNGITDAAGAYRDFYIGGTENLTITDVDGPDIRLYMNNDQFVSGGTTNEEPVLLAYISDTSGINTVGSGIGHDVAAVLDENTDKTIVLNDYYESDLNTYKSGIVRYPFAELAPGPHNLRLKVWDVYNNSSEHSLDFVVAESASLALTHVLNYPNPFTTYTEFWFEHNQPCCGLDVIIQIFTITGKLVKTIDTQVETNGFRVDPIPWDGTDDYGDNIGKGVYIYKLKVRGIDGAIAEVTEKLVILK